MYVYIVRMYIYSYGCMAKEKVHPKTPQKPGIINSKLTSSPNKHTHPHIQACIVYLRPGDGVGDRREYNHEEPDESWEPGGDFELIRTGEEGGWDDLPEEQYHCYWDYDGGVAATTKQKIMGQRKENLDYIT